MAIRSFIEIADDDTGEFPRSRRSESARVQRYETMAGSLIGSGRRQKYRSRSRRERFVARSARGTIAAARISHLGAEAMEWR